MFPFLIRSQNKPARGLGWHALSHAVSNAFCGRSHSRKSSIPAPFHSETTSEKQRPNFMSKPRILITVLCGTERGDWLNPDLSMALFQMAKDSRFQVQSRASLGFQMDSDRVSLLARWCGLRREQISGDLGQAWLAPDSCPGSRNNEPVKFVVDSK